MAGSAEVPVHGWREEGRRIGISEEACDTGERGHATGIQLPILRAQEGIIDDDNRKGFLESIINKKNPPRRRPDIIEY